MTDESSVDHGIVRDEPRTEASPAAEQLHFNTAILAGEGQMSNEAVAPRQAEAIPPSSTPSRYSHPQQSHLPVDDSRDSASTSDDSGDSRADHAHSSRDSNSSSSKEHPKDRIVIRMGLVLPQVDDNDCNVNRSRDATNAPDSAVINEAVRAPIEAAVSGGPIAKTGVDHAQEAEDSASAACGIHSGKQYSSRVRQG